MQILNPPRSAGAAGAISLALLFFASTSHAGSATWKASPATGDWNTAANWKPATVPNGAADTATFASSNVTNVSLSSGVEVSGIVFSAGASPFTITVNPPAQQFQLSITGAGITNNSGVTQHFVTGDDAGGAVGEIVFRNQAAAGNMTVFTNKGGVFGGAQGAGGGVEFYDRSTAEGANFVNQAGAVTGAGGGFVFFAAGATAATGTFTNNGATVSGAGSGELHLFRGADAGGAAIVNNGGTAAGANGGATILDAGTEGAFTSSAGTATMIANAGTNGGHGGVISFEGKGPIGGLPAIEVFGNGVFAIDQHRSPTVTVGLIEGDGMISLGANNLIVGGIKLNGTFSGVISDGGAGGSLTVKMQRRILYLTGANTYTGGTTIKNGRLSVSNKSGSGTGTGPVQVNGGSRSTLIGNGTIFGPVTIGDGNGDAGLSPFSPQTNTGTLTIKNTLTFNPMSNYLWVATTANGVADTVIAAGVTINSNVTFFTADTASVKLPKGTVFTALKNTSATPIVGTFSNLPDGATFTVGLNTYKANYEGGTGNDLTLTVQ
jgi:autotransporter-associated beta strand protein